MKISIITPNYNYSEFLPELFESILSQDYQNWEHIIVDDGSTDNSVKIIEEYSAKSNGRIHLIKQDNHGQTFTINRALEKTAGDVIAWINSDDSYCSGVFSRIIDSFEKQPDVDAIFGDILIINGSGHLIKKNRYLNFHYPTGTFIGFGKTISSNAIFWKRHLTEEVGLLNEGLSFVMDSEYWSRLLWNRNVIHINIPIANFRWHSQAKTIQRKEKGSIAYLKAKAEDRFVFENSYYKLKISRVLPIKATFPIYIVLKLRRHFLRFIYGHYRR